MLTVWCLAVAFLTPWVVGGPVLWLTRGSRPVRSADWLLAPFLGLAVLVGVLQSLAVLADLPLDRTVPWFWAAVALGWVGLLSSLRGRASLRAVPLRALAVALAVFLTQAAALLLVGVSGYRGLFFTDQFNYVLIAQFLTEVPVSTPMSDIGARPWLVLPVVLSGDRLGQSVIHGFLALTAGRDAIDMYFPTALLGPALIAPAVLMLAPYLGLFRWRAARAAFAAGVVPGVTAVFVDCYLSHLLFVPMLYAFFGAAVRALRRPRDLVAVGLVGALAFAVYTEFAPFLVVVAVVVAASARVLGRVSSVRSGALVLTAAAAPVLNPAAVKTVTAIFDRSQQLGRQIDFAHSPGFMIARQWTDADRAAVIGSAGRRPRPTALVAALTAISLAAWTARAATARRRSVPVYCAAAALLLVPVGGWAVKPDARYAIYKALCTVAPLLALGLELAGTARAAPRGGAWRTAWRRARWAVPVVAVPALAYYTVVGQWQTLRAVNVHTATARAWNDPAVQEVSRFLRARGPSDVVIDIGEAEDSWAAAGAFWYTGRHHRILLASPKRIWMYEALPPPAGPFAPALGSDGALLVGPRGPVPPGAELLFRNDAFQVLRLAPPGKLP